MQTEIAETFARMKALQDGIGTLAADLIKLSASVNAYENEIIALDEKTDVLSNDKTTADRITSQLAALDASKVELLSERAKLLKEMRDLSRTINTVLARNADDKPAGADDVPVNELHLHLEALLKFVTTHLQNKPIAEQELRGGDARIATLLPPLRTSIEAFRLNSGVSDEEAALIASLEDAWVRLNAPGNADLLDKAAVEAEASTLSAVLYRKYPDFELEDQEKNITRLGEYAVDLADNIKTEIIDKKISAQLLLKNLGSKTKGEDFVKEVLDLKTKIEALELEEVGLVVRIREAKFGDTFQPTYNDCKKSTLDDLSACKRKAKQIKRKLYRAERWCDATANLRNLCDRQKNCALPADFNTTVCGFDPAPAADPRYRGVYVDYDCVRNIDASFEGIYPAGSAVVSRDPLPQKADDDYVVLRKGGSILCAR